MKQPFVLNKKIAKLTPYEPISGEYEVRLDANESYVNLNEKTLEKISKRLAKLDFNRYPDPYAKKLCERIAINYNVDANLVTVGNGSDELIGVIMASFLEKGDKALSFTPDFSMYKFYSDLYEVEMFQMQKNEQLQIDMQKVIDFINENNVKCVIFSNPCNPTSLGESADRVRNLLESVNCLVVLDEAYMDFWDESLINEFEKYDNLIILKTLSKAYGMASIRVGFALANQKLTGVLKSAKSPYNVNAVSQLIAEVILEEKQENKNNLSEIILNCKQLYGKIEELNQKYSVFEKVYQTKTNFVLVKTSKSKEIFNKLIEKSIVIRCIGNYLRITTGDKKQNQILIKELEKIIQEV